MTVTPNTNTTGITSVWAGNFCLNAGATALTETVLPYYPHVRFGIRLQVLETIGSSTVNYFDGYITDVTAIPQNGTYWTTEVNAADIFGRMGSTTNLQGYLLEEMLLDSPVSLNPFQEAEGATSFGDISGTQPGCHDRQQQVRSRCRRRGSVPVR